MHRFLVGLLAVFASSSDDVACITAASTDTVSHVGDPTVVGPARDNLRDDP